MDDMSDTAREYVRVIPAEDTLTASTVETHLRRFHSLRLDTTDGLLSRFREDPPATIECLLLSTDEGITYAFSIDDAEQVNTLERILRALFPSSYDLERTTLPERDILETHDAGTAVEYYGVAERRDDWQTGLTAFDSFHEESESHVPLATLVETMANTDVPMAYQTLIQAKADWSSAADERELDIAWGTDTLGGRLIEAILMPVDDEKPDPSPSQERRMEALRARDSRRSFGVNARLVAFDGETDTANPTELTNVFDGLHGDMHEVTGIERTGQKAEAVRQSIRERTFRPPAYERAVTHLPWTRNRSPGIVADPSELGGFCLVGGNLAGESSRGLDATHEERTNLQLPPERHLRPYQDRGLTLGRPVNHDGETGSPLALPTSLQSMHVAWFGKTGSGKSTALTAAMLDNHEASEGADVFIDPKGDGMTVDYLRAHHARYGNLDDVLYFDCTELLPAVSMFDIRPLLNAGMPRDQAVEHVVAHYLEMLQAVMGTERFERAVRSPDVIRALIKALFDPVNGSDAFSHRDLHAATRRLASRQTAPPVSDPELERTLEGLVENDSRTFQDIMQGVSNRIEKITLDKRLSTMFNHVAPENGEDQADTPNLDFGDLLDEDKTIIFDLGGLRSEATRVVSLVVLSALWSALKRRAESEDDSDSPVVNLYLEEAASLAVTDLLSELLSQGRGFGLSVTLAMQYPAQLRNADERAYDEVLNDVGTFVVGNVPIDRKLAERFATSDMQRDDVGARLRALGRGEWVVKPAAEYGAPDPRPFQVESVTPPQGHPAADGGGVDILDAPTRGFQTALHDVRQDTKETAGLTVQRARATDDRTEGRVTRESDSEFESDSGSESSTSSLPRVDTALPHTQRMPERVRYDGDAHTLVCTACENRYAPRMEGMEQALRCCAESENPLEAVERDDVPICTLDLKLSEEERAVSEYSTAQLCFLQAVFNASQLRYQNLGYDLRYDSMVRLREYTGVDTDAVGELVDDGLVREDCTRPHKLYSLTPDGRKEINESFREGIAYGHGSGDLDESSQHVLAVELGREFLEEAFVQDTESDAVEVQPYFEPKGMDARLDCVALDADGDVVVALEAERVNNDVGEAVPSDFDKMAACEPEEAIWVVMSRKGGHRVLQALNDPIDGEPRVEKTYSDSTNPREFTIDTSGLNRMYTLNYLANTLLADENSQQ